MEINLFENNDVENDEAHYDSPNNSEWIIGIDLYGSVFVIETPNIHPSFLEFTTAEDLGIPFEFDNEDPGIYKMRCSFHTSTDYESGTCDGYEFYSEELTKLWPNI